MYLLLRLNQGVLSLCLHLNFLVHFLLQSSSVCCPYCCHILVFCLPQFYSLYSYSSLPNVQIPCNYNSSDSPFYPHPWCMGCIEQTLLSVESAPLLHLSFLLPPSEQILLEPAVGAFLASLVILEAMALVVWMFLVV